MNQETADAVVFFGATGDLAHKKYFQPFKRLPNGQSKTSCSAD
jgi:hypothetical protein